LIYIGGVLVIFAYVAALAPNSQFRLSSTSIFPIFLFFCFFLSSLFLETKILTLNVFSSLPQQHFNAVGASLYRTINTEILIFLALILLLALIIVVKICFFHWGPLRPFK
jgi:hypothetical protein